MNGLMTVTASGGTGDLPTGEPEPANVEWPLLRGLLVNAPIFLAFGTPLLVLLYLFRRAENRSRDAWRIVKPALICVILWQAGLFATGAPAIGYLLIAPYLLTAVAVWLWSERLAKMSPWLCPFLICAVGSLMVLAVGIGAAMAADRPDETFAMAAIGSVPIILGLSAMLSGRWLARRGYSEFRFRLWQLAWHIVVPTLAMFALWYTDPTGNDKELVPVGAASGFVCGIFHMCFLLYVSWNPLYRQRFHALLRLKDPREGDS